MATIQAYLNGIQELSAMGKFKVMAQCGIFRDLVTKSDGDVRHGVNLKTWDGVYETNENKADIVKKIRAASKGAVVWLATDPDREGEAMAWHTSVSALVKPVKVHRVRYHEITKHALKQAFLAPSTVDMHLVHAQMTRQILDRLIGFELSALVGRGRSAGRVQSAAQRIVDDRAHLLRETDWTQRKLVLTGSFSALPTTCASEFADMQALGAEVDRLAAAAPIKGVVASVEATQENELPPPPFNTSSLQQVAHKALRMGPKDTMRHAQTLFEQGLITYHRTDATTLSPEAMQAFKQLAAARYGDAMAVERRYKTKAINAQEAHEAVRPTRPKDASELALGNGPEAALYDMIFKRTLATQMAAAVYDKMAYTIDAAGHSWAGSCRKLVVQGWKVLYGRPDEDAAEGKAGMAVKLKDVVVLEALAGGERLPPAPAMYTEASLVKAMEDEGIGRPSTYSSTIEKLFQRAYVKTGAFEGPKVFLESIAWSSGQAAAQRKRVEQAAFAFKDVLVPTELGEQVMSYLKGNVGNVVDLKFTSSLEKTLDRVSTGKNDHRAVLGQFWAAFLPVVSALPPMAGGSGGTGAALEVVTTKFGPAVVVRGQGDERRYVDIKPYVEFKGSQDLTAEELEGFAAIPKDLGDGVLLCMGRTGFYVKGLGDLPKAMWPRFYEVSLSDVKAALGGAQFSVGADQWTACETQYGPALKSNGRYVNLDHYFKGTGKTLQTLDQADIAFVTSLPKDLGTGHELACGRNGFYVKGPEVNGDIPHELVRDGAALTLARVREALSSTLRSFQIGSATWVARAGKFGPVLQGPSLADGKPRYVDLAYYLTSKKKKIETLSHEDVALLACLPKNLGKDYVLSVGQYGFYVRDPDGKCRTVNEAICPRLNEVTLEDVLEMVQARSPFQPSSSSSGRPKASASGSRSKKK